jgi:hypothetical protein
MRPGCGPGPFHGQLVEVGACMVRCSLTRNSFPSPRARRAAAGVDRMLLGTSRGPRFLRGDQSGRDQGGRHCRHPQGSERDAPQVSALDLQRYAAEMEEERGFAHRDVVSQCLLLGEEVGELFKAVRKHEKI